MPLSDVVRIETAVRIMQHYLNTGKYQDYLQWDSLRS